MTEIAETNVPYISSSAETPPPTRRSGRSVKVSCAVSICKNDSLTLLNDVPVKMFDYPGSLNSDQLRGWVHAIPDLTLSSTPQKVCEEHFESDPMVTGCLPSKKLSVITNSSSKNRKRKNEDTSPHPQLERVSSDQGPSSNKRDEPLPRSPSHNGHDYAAVTVTPIMKTSAKKPYISPSVSDSGIRPATKGICVRGSDGVMRPISTATGRMYQKVGPDGQMSRLIQRPDGKIVRVISCTKKSLQDPIDLSKYEKKRSDESAATATITSSKPLDLSTLFGNSTPSSVEPMEDNDANEPGSSMASSLNLTLDDAIDGNGQKPSQTSDGVATESTTNLQSLLSQLQQPSPVGSSSVYSNGAQSATGSGHTSHAVNDSSCSTCMAQLPNIRKSLGRLELRLDTMVGMVRSIIGRQSYSAGIRMQPPSRMGADVSGPPRVSAAPIRRIVTPSVQGATTSSIRFETMRSKHDQSLATSRLPLRSAPSFTAAATPRLTPGSASEKIGTPLPIKKGVATKPSIIKKPSAGPQNAIVSPVSVGKPAEPSDVLTSKDKELNANSLISSLFSEATATSLKASSNVIPSNDPYSVKRRIARALLLFNGSVFKFGDFRKSCSPEIRAAGKSMMESVLRQLIDDGLLYMEDDGDPLMGNDTVWQKEQAKGNLRPLKKYDIKMETFLETLSYSMESPAAGEDEDNVAPSPKGSTPSSE